MYFNICSSLLEIIIPVNHLVCIHILKSVSKTTNYKLDLCFINLVLRQDFQIFHHQELGLGFKVGACFMVMNIMMLER